MHDSYKDREVARLIKVQERVRELARTSPDFRNALLRGFDDFCVITERIGKARRKLERREYLLARQLLQSGRLFAPSSDTRHGIFIVRFAGTCPSALARAAQSPRKGRLPRRLERQLAKAALPWLDHRLACSVPDLPVPDPAKHAGAIDASIATGEHEHFQWRVEPARPAKWPTLPEPHSVALEDLRKWSRAKYVAIALYWLGGLADAGSVRLLVPQPAESADVSGSRFPQWATRYPTDDAHGIRGGGPLNPMLLKAQVAEQFLADVVDSVRPTGVSGEVERRTPNAADTDFQPASWFGKELGSRLRMAASPQRKTKKVRAKTVDGVVLYSVSDVVRWWPDVWEKCANLRKDASIRATR